jgi:D-alanyl-D-alanine dipeptidase
MTAHGKEGAEPVRVCALDRLEPRFRDKVKLVFAAMEKLGMDPVAFETWRSEARQLWLYGVGRTHDVGRKPVTWTKRSRHEDGRAVDVVSASRGWNWPEFYVQLGLCAQRFGLRTLKVERCHLEDAG